MISAAIQSFTPTVISTPNKIANVSLEISPWRGLLAVEPDIAVLNARSLLLTKANYRVTRATSDQDLFLRDTKEVPLAILSDHLGHRLLGDVARTIRRHWPRTRILILGQVPIAFEDYLYDEHIRRSAHPQQVLEELERLYEGMWNQRSNTLDWRAIRPSAFCARPPISESDPTKVVSPAPSEDRTARDRPTDIRIPATRAN